MKTRIMNLNETELAGRQYAKELAQLLATGLGQALKTEFTWETIFFSGGVRIYMHASQHGLRLFTQHSDEQILIIIEAPQSIAACLESLKRTLADQRPDLAEYLVRC